MLAAAGYMLLYSDGAPVSLRFISRHFHAPLFGTLTYEIPLIHSFENHVYSLINDRDRVFMP